MMRNSIALIGDYNKKVIAHDAIPKALELASRLLEIDITWSWLESNTLGDSDACDLEKFAAFWIVPGSPYADMDGVLRAIQFARERRCPLLGTCGGFQHALIEYARNVCNLPDAEHAETSPDHHTLIVTPLECSLVGEIGEITFTPGSQLYRIFKGQKTIERYHCNYGLNPEWKSRLEMAGLNFTGLDAQHQVRAFELPTHPFFIGTLFQPERSALDGNVHPCVLAFIQEAFRQ